MLTKEQINKALCDSRLTVRRLAVLSYLRKRQAGATMREIELDLNLKMENWFQPTSIYGIMLWLTTMKYTTRHSDYPTIYTITAEGHRVLEEAVGLLI